MLYNGEWGAMSDRSWNAPETVVTCRQLGYKFGYYVRSNLTDKILHRRFSLLDIVCTGTESSLRECQHSYQGEFSSASSSNYIYLHCSNHSKYCKTYSDCE